MCRRRRRFRLACESSESVVAHVWTDARAEAGELIAIVGASRHGGCWRVEGKASGGESWGLLRQWFEADEDLKVVEKLAFDLKLYHRFEHVRHVGPWRNLVNEEGASWKDSIT